MKIDFKRFEKLSKKEAKKITIFSDQVSRGYDVHIAFTIEKHRSSDIYGIFETYICNDKKQTCAYREYSKDKQYGLELITRNTFYLKQRNIIGIESDIKKAQEIAQADYIATLQIKLKQKARITYSIN